MDVIGHDHKSIQEKWMKFLYTVQGINGLFGVARSCKIRHAMKCVCRDKKKFFSFREMALCH